MNLRRVLAVAHKEWREIVRDRIYFLLAFLLPVMLMLVFGYGMSQDVENVAFAVLDEDRTPMSRDYAHHFIDSRYFSYQGHLMSAKEADRLLADRKVWVVIVIGPNFERRILEGRGAEAQALIDGTFTTSARTIRAYVEAINAAASARVQVGYLTRKLGLSTDEAIQLLQPVKLEVRYLYNQEVRSIWAVAPSLMMLILILVPPLLMALSVVREKETGAIYNICASTITRAEFLAGKLLPIIGIAGANALILWGIAVWYFGAPFKGSAIFFVLATLTYVLCTTSLGLLISLLVKTQQAAMIISTVLSVIIAIQFSGFITPAASLQGGAWVVAHIFPALYYNDVVKGVFLKGVGFAVLWFDVAVFVLFACVVLVLCHALFRKRMRA